MKLMTRRFRQVAIVALVAMLNLGLLFAVSPAVGSGRASAAGPNGSSTVNPPRPEVLVVQIPFRDTAERDRLANEWGADEVDTSHGYITVWTDRPTYNLMLAKGLQVTIDQQTTKQANNPNLFGGGGTDTFFGGYKTVEEMQTFLDQYAASYPNLAEKIDIGDSWCKVHAGSCTRPNANNGYDLWALHITNRSIPGPKPVFWYDAGIHSREIATPEVAMNFIAYLLDNYSTNADAHWLVDYQDIWVMPMMNPDGHHIVEAGGSSPYYQRKSGNFTNGCSTWPPTSSSQFGIDLNRNYPFQWGAHGGSSNVVCDQTYRGPSPNDVEVAAVTAKISALIPDQNGSGTTEGTVNAAPLTATGVIQGMHSYAQLDLYPWGGVSNTPPNGADLANIGAHMAATNADPAGNGYTAESGLQLYATDGTSDDWGYGQLGAAAFTTELGDDGGGFFPAYNYAINTLWPGNKGMLLYLAKIARTPYLTTRGPDARTVAVSPTSVAQGTPANLTASINYAWTGNTYAQNVAAAEYYVDTPPWAGGTAIAMGGSFTSQTVAASASVNTSGLSVGQHIIYVRGRGVNNYSGLQSWGAVSAVFLTVTAGGGPTNTPTNTATPAPPTNTPTNTPTPGCTGGTYQRSTSTGVSIVAGSTDIGNHTDDGITTVSLPFAYTFYGQSFSSANVDSNGNLQFTSNASQFSNTALPSTNLNNDIAVHWDDLRTDATGSGVFTSVSGSAPNRIFNIEWRATLYSGGGAVNFEIRLYEGQQRIDLVYGSVSGSGSSATVGIQKGTGSLFDQFSANSASLSSGLQISYQASSCGSPTPTNTPGPPTATPTNTPLPPTATPTNTPGACGNIVLNPGFETGSLSSWTVQDSGPAPTVSTTQRHTGSFSVLVGSLNPATDSSLYQAVTVPAGTSTLSYWYWPHTQDTITYDWQDAYVVNTSGTILATIMHVDSNAQAWTNVTFNMSAYAGQTVRIKFLAHDDNFAGDPTYMYVDDISLSCP